MDAVACTLSCGALQLSARRSDPSRQSPKATIVALPGGGYTGAYWHHPKYPESSLLDLGAHLGYRVFAVDRPGYGASSAQHPEGVGLAEQVECLTDILNTVGAQPDAGAGIFLVGHSLGGILSLLVASRPRLPKLLGMDVSGVPYRFSPQLSAAVSAAIDLPGAPSESSAATMFYGPKGSYEPSLLSSGGDISAAQCPLIELDESRVWPDQFASVASGITVPVQYTLGEYEMVTLSDTASLQEIAALFTASPRILMHRQPGAGHNISLHHVGRAYHLRALAFFDEVLALSRSRSAAVRSDPGGNRSIQTAARSSTRAGSNE
jgi:pimeloyl-ACP methyl ester carboxylesterase